MDLGILLSLGFAVAWTSRRGVLVDQQLRRCRYRDLERLERLRQTYTMVTAVVGIVGVFLFPWGLLLTVWSIGCVWYHDKKFGF